MRCLPTALAAISLSHQRLCIEPNLYRHSRTNRAWGTSIQRSSNTILSCHGCSLPEFEAPELPCGESQDWATVENLDQFFSRVYDYWDGKGFTNILMSRVLNIIALGFTITFSGLLLLLVNWSALRAKCVEEETCDITDVLFYSHPYGEAGQPIAGLVLMNTIAYI